MKMKTFLTTGTPIAAISIIALSISLYCKYFQNIKSCVHKDTRPASLPVNDSHTEVQPISNPFPDI